MFKLTTVPIWHFNVLAPDFFTAQFKEVFNKKSNNSTEKWPYFKCISYTFCNLVKALIYAQSKQHIELRCTHKKLYLLHTYFCCHGKTRKNTAMLISKIFLYVPGVIFIYSRVEPSVYIIFRPCCRELTRFSGNHISRHAPCFFSTPVYQISLRFVFHQEYFNKVVRFVSVVGKWQYIVFSLRIFQLVTH